MSRRDEWKELLTPEWRQQFEDDGEESVQFDVSNHNHKSQERQHAALYWLVEKRNARELREKCIFGIVVVTLVLTAIGLVIAVVQLF